MFDLGFSEFLVISVVALIVIGPERLPKVARTLGHLLGRVQRYVSDVKSDIEREMQLEDLKKLQTQVQQQARELETSFRKELGQADTALSKIEEEVRDGLDDLARPEKSNAEPPAFALEPPGETAQTRMDAEQDATKQDEADRSQLDLGLEHSSSHIASVDKK